MFDVIHRKHNHLCSRDGEEHAARDTGRYGWIIKMNAAWAYIIVGGVLIVTGGIMAGYGWHIMPNSESSKIDPNPVAIQKPTSIPLIDLELERVKGDPDFAQFKIQFAYDIFLQNKSNVPISHIQVSRLVDPQKNRQKIAIHPNAQGKIAPFHKKINVLAPGERKKIYREHSSSYEFSRFSITYKDEYGKRYHCVLEGDRDGVYLKSNYETFISKNKE